jgi:uncharacterized membrane protein
MEKRKGAQIVAFESGTRRTVHNGESQARLWQRWGLLLGGSALALYAVKRRPASIALAAAGGLMAYRGATLAGTGMYQAESSFAINCTPEEAYRFWRNFENLPLFMRNLESVRVKDGRSEWTAFGPLGARLQWTAEIAEERENQYLAWRSVEDSEFENSGSVEFIAAPGNRGTIVRASMHYDPPGGAIGRAAAIIFGKDPALTLREDLRRFKAMMEMGEIPAIEGQPHGPRSTKVSILHAIYPHQRKASEYWASQRIAERRAS